ncbi:YD repeat [Methylocaldum marinum]|uniref:YD repeat n=1 Tax=Methylocaldum marinum TaxID=1432792 RepID=A0A250KMT7_9GAMM|nr:RHS repeat-associated core domain-containing protein [Methylocaldum marinum]BBA33020.1 YD repeat [Methylocaldum marinum]
MNQRLIESRLEDVSTRYRYDPLGRRIEKRTGDKVTTFVWDGDALVGDWIEDPTDPVVPAKGVAREWVYYPETFELLALLGGRRGPNTLLHDHNDPNGCPIRLTDSKGEILWAASYTAWGQLARLHVGYVDNPIRLQGQYFDEETGSHYNRHRYFNPEAQLFVSQDPARLMAASNLYTFGPNANGWVDPLGLNPTCRMTGRRVDRASDLPIVRPGTPQWNEAVAALRRGGRGDIRVATIQDAKALLREARGNMDRRKNYTQAFYRKGYEVHNAQNPLSRARETAVGNDLRHIKWVEGTSKNDWSEGHIFFGNVFEP